MNISVFAHFDKDNIIDDYVIYYLRALRAVSEKIIFVSDCDLSSDELQKLEGIADYCLAKKHGEYDFGSYKQRVGNCFGKWSFGRADTYTFAMTAATGILPLSRFIMKWKQKHVISGGLRATEIFLRGIFILVPRQMTGMCNHILWFLKNRSLSRTFLRNL